MTLVTLACLCALLLVSSQFGFAASQAAGDEVCAEGIPMDLFCIAQGFLFDNPSIVTLEGPFEHSVHCLIEVDECIVTPYEILLPPNGQDGSTTTYTRGYRLDDATKAEVMALARRVGVCGSCDGGGTIQKGLTVVVKGRIVSEAASDIPPTISGNVTLSDPNTPGCTPAGQPTSPAFPPGTPRPAVAAVAPTPATRVPSPTASSPLSLLPLPTSFSPAAISTAPALLPTPSHPSSTPSVSIASTPSAAMPPVAAAAPMTTTTPAPAPAGVPPTSQSSSSRPGFVADTTTLCSIGLSIMAVAVSECLIVGAAL